MARRSPRARFATPFVVVLGCGRPPAPPEEPRATDDEVASAPPADARPPLRFIDAAPPDAERFPDADPGELAIREAHCSGRLKPQWHCNPPPPPDPNANPPSPTKARVINVEVQGEYTIVTIDRGSRDGVDNGWRGNLVNDQGKRVKGSDFVVFKITERMSWAKVKLTSDEVQANPYARLVPDEE